MNTEAFFAAIRARPFDGAMSQSQVEGVNTILAAFDKFKLNDRRFKAYMLATAFHETAYTMQPVREEGEGQGRPYGKPDGPHQQIYYGRGFVQLTWYENYVNAQLHLAQAGVTNNIVASPDDALKPDIAAAIMVLGMIQGWFTGKRLSDYFNTSICDWTGARRIINGQDRAQLIAIYAEYFNGALVASID